MATGQHMHIAFLLHLIVPAASPGPWAGAAVEPCRLHAV